MILDAAGNLYGTTYLGGSPGCSLQHYSACGSVFKINPKGKEKILMRFSNWRKYGDFPYGPLMLDSAGNLFGTASLKGPEGFGTIFKLNASDKTVLHSFRVGSFGLPSSGLTEDASGNLYGTTAVGAGNVYRLDPVGNYASFFEFNGSDGSDPFLSGVVIDRAGNLYGTTYFGGKQNVCNYSSCGVVYKLDRSGNETILYEFTGGTDGSYPLSQLTFDPAGSGRIYGTASAANFGGQTAGSVFELTSSGGNWTFNLVYAFPGGDQGLPAGGVVFDSQGNLWGYQAYGGAENCGSPQIGELCGSIYKLSPSPSGWTETNEFAFTATTGGGPSGNMVADQAGNFYGTLDNAGPYGSGGVFKFVPSTGEFNLIYSDTGDPGDFAGPSGGVIMDPVGNLYAADEADGPFRCAPFGCGFVFELSPVNGGWYFTNLHNFTGGSDGGVPIGPLALDAEGNIYGADFDNVIFEIMP